MWYGNKRGIRESGRTFSIPTYFFLGATFLMLAVGLIKHFTGGVARVESVSDVIQADRSLTLFLLLRAFASGSTAVTGVEAISNGITAFEEPKSRNAAATMAWMCALLGTMFIGITALALATHAQASTSETVISQLGRTVFGAQSPFYVAVIFGTAGVLVMAANTSFADFPRLAALHAGDGFLPRWMTDRDNRLVYGIGITVLTVSSGLLIAIFKADVSRLIPLYAIGVFVSFSISQSGMVVRWFKTSRLKPGEQVPSYSPEGVLVTTLKHDRHWRFKAALNAFGALMTIVVTFIFALAKFTEGAWVTVILVPSLVFVFFRIHHHYRSVKSSLALDQTDISSYLNEVVHRIRILSVSALDKRTLPALREMVQTRTPHVALQAVHIDVNENDANALRALWLGEHIAAMGIPLVIVPSEYGGGNIVDDLQQYISRLLEKDASLHVELVIPEWTPGSGWA